MKKVIWKPYWNFEKEEIWINDMAEQGWSLVKYTWCRYVFEQTPKGKYAYRLELLEHAPGSRESRDYLRFMEDAGVEVVSTYMRWVYFRKESSDGPFDIYTDADSKIKHYGRVKSLVLFFAILEFVAGGMNFVVGLMAFLRGGEAPRFTFWLSIGLLGLGFFLYSLAAAMGRRIKTLEVEKTIRE